MSSNNVRRDFNFLAWTERTGGGRRLMGPRGRVKTSSSATESFAEADDPEVTAAPGGSRRLPRAVRNPYSAGARAWLTRRRRDPSPTAAPGPFLNRCLDFEKTSDHETKRRSPHRKRKKHGQHPRSEPRAPPRPPKLSALNADGGGGGGAAGAKQPGENKAGFNTLGVETARAPNSARPFGHRPPRLPRKEEAKSPPLTQGLVRGPFSRRRVARKQKGLRGSEWDGGSFSPGTEPPRDTQPPVPALVVVRDPSRQSGSTPKASREHAGSRSAGLGPARSRQGGFSCVPLSAAGLRRLSSGK